VSQQRLPLKAQERNRQIFTFSGGFCSISEEIFKIRSLPMGETCHLLLRRCHYRAGQQQHYFCLLGVISNSQKYAQWKL